MNGEDSADILSGTLTIGVDEAGRGCLSGPVFAGAVLATPALIDSGIADSKLLSVKKRDSAEKHIREHSLCAVGHATLDEILRINIRNAAALAMKRAVELLYSRLMLPEMSQLQVIIDGNHAIACNLPVNSHVRTEIAGDRRFISVAAASVIAKTARDRYMKAAAEIFPAYGWERNNGYGTKEHLAALAHHGITPLHRKGFSPIKDMQHDT